MVQHERDPNHPLAGPNGAVPVLVGIVIVIAAIVWDALRLGIAWAGTTTYVTTNPVGLLVGLAGGTVAWPRQATYALVLILVTIAALAGGVAFAHGGPAAVAGPGSTRPRMTSAAAVTSRPPRERPSPRLRNVSA